MATQNQIFDLTMTGHNEFERVLASAAVMADPVLVRTMREGFEAAFRVSQVQVPFRFGTLKASGRINGPSKNGPNWEVELVYGNTAVAYALYQHEGIRRDGSHRIRHYHNGKKGHFVTDPVNAVIPMLTPALMARVDELFSKGVIR